MGMNLIHATARRQMSVVLAVCVIALSAAAGRAQTALEALRLAPGSADLVVLIPSLNRVNQKLAMVNTEMGFNFPGGEDMVGQLRQSFGLEEGIDLDKPLLVVVTGLAQAIENDTEPLAMAVVPTTDYAAFAQSLGGNPQENVSQVELPNGELGFVRKSGSYAVVSMDRPSVEGYEAAGAGGALAGGLGKLGGQYASLGDAMVLVNLRALAGTIQSKLAEGRKQMDAEFANADPDAMGGMDPASIKAMVGAYIDAVEKVVRDAATATLSVDVTEKGAGLSATVQFQDDSEMAKVCSTPKGGPSMLNMLPNQPYLIASSFDLEGSGVMKFFMDLLSAIPDGDQPLFKMLKQNIAMMDSVQGMAQTMLAPQQLNLMGGGMFTAVTVVKTADGAGYLKKYAQSLRDMNGLQIPLGPLPNGQPGTMTFSSQYTENAMTVDGVRVDQYGLSYQFPPEMMEMMGPMAPLVMALGMGGQQGYIASTNNHVVMTTSLDAQVVNGALAAVKAGNGLGSRGEFAQIREHLPSAPHGEMYLSVSGVMDTVNKFMQMFGQPALAAPADLPPVAFWVSIEEGGLAKRLYVPMPVAQFIKDLAEMAPAMMGGQGGGGQAQPQPQRQDPSGPPPAPF